MPTALPSYDGPKVLQMTGTDEPLPGKVINPLREALEQLHVPYSIDLVDWHRCSEAFREVAGPQRVALEG